MCMKSGKRFGDVRNKLYLCGEVENSDSMKKLITILLLMICVSIGAQTDPIIKEDKLRDGYEHFVFRELDSDNDRKNAEYFSFQYHFVSEGGYEGYLYGIVIGISATTDKQGRYLMYYKVIDPIKKDYTGEQRVCTIKKTFGDYIRKYVKSRANHLTVLESSIAVLEGLAAKYHVGDKRIFWIEDEVIAVYSAQRQQFYRRNRQKEHPYRK